MKLEIRKDVRKFVTLSVDEVKSILREHLRQEATATGGACGFEQDEVARTNIEFVMTWSEMREVEEVRVVFEPTIEETSA